MRGSVGVRGRGWGGVLGLSVICKQTGFITWSWARQEGYGPRDRPLDE